ncbi:ferric reductase-like transmembrane domain-containing protein [uncultured Roseobacter sp.]|uniref:ferric reductase-like transmembrane domain-containing protein n=1 Tax=uncultured Roseobacter sp. TaxID=114847 RepID=UPI00263434AC|nr:ferric reductase-like transmembrane domain-containing protein [uncultured Roseobacter sp.]
MGRVLRGTLIWGALVLSMSVPLIAAGMSPLLAWRDPVYIVAGFAGVIGLALLVLQPLLAAGALPGVPGARGRRVHRWVGASLIAAILVHVIGLWLTSPPDVIDALLFVSPTPFSAWGVIAMWCAFGAALLAVFRRKLRLHPRLWRGFHMSLACVIVGATAIHAVLIDGTMEPITKAALCAVAVLATALAAVRITARRR